MIEIWMKHHEVSDGNCNTVNLEPPPKKKYKKEEEKGVKKRNDNQCEVNI